MELHHSKHHNTYVTNFNAATEKLATAVAEDDVTALRPLAKLQSNSMEAAT